MVIRMGKLAILHTNAPGECETNLSCLSNHLGVDVVLVCINHGSLTAQSLCNRLPGVRALAISAAAFCVLEHRGIRLRDLRGQTGDVFDHVLVYGYEPDKRHVALAGGLTGTTVSGIERMPVADTCSFPDASKPHTRQLAGCEFQRKPGTTNSFFRLEAQSGVEVLMELANKPTFIRSAFGGISCFHWTGIDTIPNPNAKWSEGSLTGSCDRFVPVIIFLRAAFAGSCWENPFKTARVIIDDPLLERTFGFLRYDDLMESLVKLNYGVTTAFIPWNYRRTKRKQAQFFIQHYPAHSVCVHGCDHTNNEFGATNFEMLAQKAWLATDRMEKHRQRTGIVHDPVMVFPQGRFSTAAIRALRLAGFQAVVNSTRVPVDSSDGALTLGEELLPATNYLSGLPLFSRRYPDHLSACALDLFLGKPAHLVEHHEWFAQGIDALSRCIQFLQQVEPELTWPTLNDGLRRQHLRRQATDGTREVHFFTPGFEFQNSESKALTFIFSKAEPEPDRVGNVTVDGNPVSFIQEDGKIIFRHEMLSSQKIEVRVNTVSLPVAKIWSPGLKYRSSVWLRRNMSDFRDNHLAKYPALLKIAKRAVRPWSSKDQVKP